MLLNCVLPIREILPIEANLAHVRAVARAREMVTECVRQRIRDVDAAAEKNEKFNLAALGTGNRDLLTLIVEERRRFKDSEDELTEQEVVDQVRLNMFF